MAVRLESLQRVVPQPAAQTAIAITRHAGAAKQGRQKTGEFMDAVSGGDNPPGLYQATGGPANG